MIYSVANIEKLIASDLQCSSELQIPGPDILTAINDGYKEVSSRAFCIEETYDATTAVDSRIIEYSGHKVIDVYCVELGKFLLNTIPQMFGINLDANNNYPQKWFQWGNYIIIDPVPSTIYNLIIYTAIPPTSPVLRDLVIYQDRILESSGISWKMMNPMSWQKIPGISLETFCDTLEVAESGIMWENVYYGAVATSYGMVWKSTADMIWQQANTTTMEVFYQTINTDNAIEWTKYGNIDLLWELPPEFQPCVYLFSLYVLSLKLDKWEMANHYYNRYISTLSKAKKEYIALQADKKILKSLTDNRR
jgi:hypothetical protein